MSWVVEVIEREAMKRAHQGMDHPTVFGMTVEQIASLRQFYFETCNGNPAATGSEEILRQLRKHRK